MQKQPKYYLNDQGGFVIENYNYAKPFANFFPGIAGKYGIPMWTFYVNRAQAIATFGVKDKDHPILEFYPANKAWQYTPSGAFRTFIKAQGAKDILYEPFHNGVVNSGFSLDNSMLVTSSGLKLREINSSLGLETSIEYFNIPSDIYAGLARIVRIKNIGRKSIKIQVIDGLPQVSPYGTNDYFLKKMSRTIEAWARVENMENKVPFFRLAVDPADRPEVIHIKEGNFYLSFSSANGRNTILKPIVDPETVFGQNSDFSCPVRFLSERNFCLPLTQTLESKTPCAFSYLSLELKPQAEMTLSTIAGFMRSIEELNGSLKRITAKGYLEKKRLENIKLIEDLQQDVETKSSFPAFDLYAKQTYLDNILRGGYPYIFNKPGKASVFHLYSRKHGDLERDYNDFLVQPTYFSQGNGNYRDINQNRRSNVWFNPEIKEADLVSMVNLIQLDGFNPLIVKGALFVLEDKAGLSKALKNFMPAKDILRLTGFAKKPFAPGDAVLFLQDNGIELKIEKDRFLDILIGCCRQIQEAIHGEGFWSDHWTYNLDLLESYLGIYPEKLNSILFEKNCFTYFDNIEIVKPRSEKYMLYNGLPRQLHSVGSDPGKKELIRRRLFDQHIVRRGFGKGRIHQVTLAEKLLCLFANKLSSLDPFSCGIEMEANKPNWYDALNGLPALFGSSLCETFELKRLCGFLKASLSKNTANTVLLTNEISSFLFRLDGLLDDKLDDFGFWDKSHTLKESYWKQTKLGVCGKKTAVKKDRLIRILDKAIDKIDTGLRKAFDQKNKVYYSYFINQVVDFQAGKPNFIRPKKFKQVKLPLFLEGQVHALRVAKDKAEAGSLAEGTKNSLLFDEKLNMYKVTAPLKDMPEEIGRCRVFTPGWLENESIWLHMEYKYMLELVRSGLYEEFYAQVKNVLIPFQKPEQYGRSILENSSFLVSSAFTDKNLHGNGFVARLSGSTAEFLQIWLLMNTGNAPFFLNKNKELNLRLSPILAGWLFDNSGKYSFNFLSKIKVTYFNPGKKDTFGKHAAKIKRIVIDGGSASRKVFISDIIPSPYAQKVRSCLVKKIDIYLG